MIHQQLDRLAVLACACPLAVDRHAFDPSRGNLVGPLGDDGDLLIELHVELDQQECLIPDRGEQVELADQVKDVGSAKAEIEGERFPRLAVQDEAGWQAESVNTSCEDHKGDQGTHSSARHSIRIFSRGASDRAPSTALITLDMR